MLSFRDQFLASAAIREKVFEIKFNGASLKGIVRIHPAKTYRDIMSRLTLEENGLAILAEQFLNAEDRSPMFTADEFDSRLPDSVMVKLYHEFIKANTGRDPEGDSPGE